MTQRELTVREAQAVAEVGHTDVSRTVARFLCLMFIGLIGLTPLTQALLDWHHREERETAWPGAVEVFRRAPEIADAFDSDPGALLDKLLAANGQLQLQLRDYESQLEQASWVRQVGLGPTQRVLTSVLRRGTEQVVLGRDGWMYFAPELNSLSAGRFWGLEGVQRSPPVDQRHTDPLPAMVAFHDELQSLGIELLLVPVPAKVAVYPEHLMAGDPLSAATETKMSAADLRGAPDRLDHWHAEFYEELSRRGVAVLDLWPLLIAQRSEELMYCRTDSHWSGAGVRVVADAIAARIRDRAWSQQIPRAAYRRDVRPVEIFGDLARLLDEQSPLRETIPLSFVGEPGESEFRPVAVWPDSPVLLLGDSHTLVFSEPDLHATGAGLAEQLAFALGFGVDVEGVRGSGGTAARQSLKRRRDGLRGKRLIIWCFASRELTESTDGWPLIPLTKRTQ